MLRHISHVDKSSDIGGLIYCLEWEGVCGIAQGEEMKG
jgi:hypothetical protein